MQTNSIKSECTALTAAPIEAGVCASNTVEFIEVQDVFRIYGIRRTMTFALIREGKIKSCLLRKPGNKSGKRLIFAPSVSAFLRGEMAKGLKG